MNFFAYQAESRRKTKVLLLLFVLAVLTIILTVYLVAVLIYVYVTCNAGHNFLALPEGWHLYWMPRVFLYSTSITAGIMLFGSINMIIKLRSGGSGVAEMLGGRRLLSNTSDLDEKRLMNVIEEMAIASGTPVPAVFILDEESTINAFAAGYSPSDSAITVTQGTLKQLNRDELQGVIAHEFSHILNGDMRLNLRLTGALQGILCLATVGYYLMRSTSRGSSSSSRNSGALYLVLFGLGIWLIGSIGLLFGKIIKSAVSRSREFLADASAVQFTRNPPGLAGALEKIANLEGHSLIASHHAETVSHMFFANAVKSAFIGLLETHPPLEERLKRLDPSIQLSAATKSRLKATVGNIGDDASPLSSPLTSGLAAPGGTVALTPQQFTNQVGRITDAHIDYARNFHAALAPELVTATHSSLSASALIFGILCNQDQPTRDRQLQFLEKGNEPTVAQETKRLLPFIEKAGETARIPLIDLAIPALRTLSKTQYVDFINKVNGLINMDGKVTISEFIIRKILTRHLQSTFGKVDRQNIAYRALPPILNDVVTTLSALALAGSTELGDAQKAYTAGCVRLTKNPPNMLLAKQLNLKILDQAFERLAQASPSLKEEIIGAAVATVAADGRVTTKELELLRAVGDSLACPIPPILAIKD